MIKKLSLFEETNKAIDQVEANANPDFKHYAWEALLQVIEQKQTFTTDDVWHILETKEIKTHDNRAMGSIMRKASKEKLIESTGQYAKTTRPSSHRRPITIWRTIK